MSDYDNSLTVGVIRDLIKRVTDYEQHSADDHAAFRATIEASLVQLRKDFHAALSPLQLDNIDHRRGHETDRLERVARQAANDKSFESMRNTLRMLTIMIAVTLALLLIGALALLILRAARPL